MRVVISAGGTGGHIYPALAIINKIKEMEPDSEFLYIGTHNRMEKDIIPKYNIPFETIEIYGINRKNLLKNFKTLKCFLQSRSKCKKLIKEFNPDCVIGVGGYVTGPVIWAGKKLGYKTFIHEQNSIPGKANLYLSKYADHIFVSFKSSINYFPEYKTTYTGNPCSEEALKKVAIDKKELDLNPNKKLVLFVMGSLGSDKMNEMLYQTMEKFKNKDYEILFVTGKDSYDEMKQKTYPKNVKVVPYIEDMTRVMKKTDVIVSRAGASTMSEIMALEVPSILIPSPYVPNNHQYKNALDLFKKDACILIEEKDVTSEKLVSSIEELLNNEEKIKTMKHSLHELSVKDSATRIYQIIKEKISL
jgi:UDP-N-acetylglucosamine--N-acetylmuramyl-(pentapeptide) pyrophosphoryl-undecaprenol N-acetylglucosamine transferase